jgi:hypothetical protein
MKGIRVQTRTLRALAAVYTLLLATTICHASRISGTYVAHGPHYAEMLQLIETDNGQISGVFSSIEVQTEGNFTSEQKPLTGAVDAGQLTLTHWLFFYARLSQELSPEIQFAFSLQIPEAPLHRQYSCIVRPMRLNITRTL